jgi:thiol-disulfide isomerase/thioredoxin
MKDTDLTIRKLFLVFSLLFTSVVLANEAEIKPFIKGSFEQIQQDHKGKPYIITFWSESCVFCMKELALFGRLSKTYSNVEIVSITTDPFLEQQKVDYILSSKELISVKKWVFADNYVERLYFDVDKKWRGELPLSYFFDRNNKMIKKVGAIKENELIDWLAKQN